jgi:RimJ/RimL family protein N-acetyltransferase
MLQHHIIVIYLELEETMITSCLALLNWMAFYGTNGYADLAIAIGENELRGKGLGQNAMKLVLEFAFHELNLHRVQLTVFDYNIQAIKLYEKLGFKHEGMYRDFIQRDGKRYNMHLYGHLQNEWNELIL